MDDDLIAAIYEERSNLMRYFPRSTPRVKEALAGRFEEEEKLALAMLLGLAAYTLLPWYFQQDMGLLKALPGIGDWTAQYIAMRVLRWPDAFPKEDSAVQKNLGGVSAKVAEEMSQRWRPWRLRTRQLKLQSFDCHAPRTLRGVVFFK